MQTTQFIQNMSELADDTPEAIGGIVILITPDHQARLFSTFPGEITKAILEQATPSIEEEAAA